MKSSFLYTITIIVLYIVLCLFNIPIVIGTCNLVQCRGDQDWCDIPGQKCSDGLYCNFGYDQPICESKFPETQSCYSDVQCEDGLLCHITGEFTDQMCQNIHFKGSGETCYHNEECNRGLICAPETLRCGLAEGQICKSDSHCPFNQYCDIGVCTDKQGLHSNCTTDSMCINGLICSQADSICISMYSVGLGQQCSHPQACKLSDGLGCKGGFCVNYTQPEDDTVKSCNSTDVCFGGNYGFVEGCICDSPEETQGSCQLITRNTGDCQKSTLALESCMWENQCPQVDNPLSYLSCRSLKCSNQFEDYHNDCNDPSYTCLSSANLLSSSILVITLTVISLLLLS